MARPISKTDKNMDDPKKKYSRPPYPEQEQEGIDQAIGLAERPAADRHHRGGEVAGCGGCVADAERAGVGAEGADVTSASGEPVAWWIS